MSKGGPGKSFREGLSITQIIRLFPDDDAAERWFAEARWPEGVWCPHCGSVNVQTGAKHKSQPYRCRDCPQAVLSQDGYGPCTTASSGYRYGPSPLT